MKFVLVSLCFVATTWAIDGDMDSKPGLTDLLTILVPGGKADFILELPAVDIDITLPGEISDDNLSKFVAELKRLTETFQRPYLAFVGLLGVESEGLWGANIIHLRNVDNLRLTAIYKFVGASGTVRPPFTVELSRPVESSENVEKAGEQWGILKIRANEAWKITQGENVVIGIIDTGVNMKHIALKDGYGGKDANSKAWLDPYYDEPSPTDVQGHGSHALGSAVGRTNGIGVAPKAKWVACRGLDNKGSGTETKLTKCAEFMLEARPFPRIITNSWGSDTSRLFFTSQINNWRKAGIIPVFAAGNVGPNCGTMASPGDQPKVITVGATDKNDVIAKFSNRGRTKDNLRKPDVSAPGVDIVSCGKGLDDYATLSGTSMATPHVAGAIALILSKFPKYNYDQVYSALINSTVKPTIANGDGVCICPSDRDCSLDCGTSYPNNAYGYGRINIGATMGV